MLGGEIKMEGILETALQQEVCIAVPFIVSGLGIQSPQGR